MLYLGISNCIELTHGVLSFLHTPSPSLFDAKYLFSAVYTELSHDFISSLSYNIYRECNALVLLGTMLGISLNYLETVAD